MEDGHRLSAVVTGNQTFGLTRAAWHGNSTLLRSGADDRRQYQGCLTGKTSWNRDPFLPSDNAESLPS
jgi:hypothetical protein